MVQSIMRKVGVNIFVFRRHHLIDPLKLATHSSGWILALLHRRKIGMPAFLRFVIIVCFAVVSPVYQIKTARDDHCNRADSPAEHDYQISLLLP